MLVKQDSSRLNNTESFLYTVSCNVDIAECFIIIWKGIPPNKDANFCLLSFFLLLIFIDFIYKLLMMFYYTHVSKRHFLNDGLRQKTTLHLFSVTNVKRK